MAQKELEVAHLTCQIDLIRGVAVEKAQEKAEENFLSLTRVRIMYLAIPQQ